MHRRHTRAALLLAAPLALAVLAGCATGGTQASAATTAADRLAAARTQTSALSSFAFRSVTELPGRTALQRTVVEGRVAVPDRVAYSVTVGSGTAEVVRIADRGFSRTLPGGSWVPASSATPVAAPAVVLRAVLDAADEPVDKGEVTFDGRSARLIEVVLTADEVRSTGLLDAAGGGDVPVTLALDTQSRVLRLAVDLPVTTGTTGGALRQVTTYGSFGSSAPIEPPV